MLFPWFDIKIFARDALANDDHSTCLIIEGMTEHDYWILNCVIFIFT